MKNYVSFDNMTQIMNSVASKFNSFNSAYTIKGNSTFEALPATLTSAMSGFVYNITNEFTTDGRFVEGAGKTYPAGTNVAIIDLSTYVEREPVGNEDPSELGWYELVNNKYVLSADTEVVAGKTYYAKDTHVYLDVFGTFVDLEPIEDDIDDLFNMVSDEFDTATAYVTGDVVIYNGQLYKFKADHAAGAWDSSEVDAITVEDLIVDSAASELTSSQVNTLIGLLD